MAESKFVQRRRRSPDRVRDTVSILPLEPLNNSVNHSEVLMGKGFAGGWLSRTVTHNPARKDLFFGTRWHWLGTKRSVWLERRPGYSVKENGAANSPRKSDRGEQVVVLWRS